MAVKIAVTREYEDEKRHVHSNRLLLFLLQKKLTALSDILFNFWRLCTWLVISHLKLLLKLHRYGIRGSTLKWIQAFLSYRTQTIDIDNEKSTTVPVTSGVPLGSVLGPIFFLIYINHLPDKTRSKVWLFVDETAIYLAVSSLEDAQILQQDLYHLNLRELDWDMELNPSKCVVIHITRSRTPVPSHYLLHGQVLESVAGSKYLGVEISNNLSFNNHIQNVTTSASQSLGFLKRNIRSKNPVLREMAYKTLVRQLVEFSSSVWSPYMYNKSNFARLEWFNVERPAGL